MPARPGSSHYLVRIPFVRYLWPWIHHQAPVKKEDSPGDLEKARSFVNIHETQDKLRINSWIYHGFTMDLPCPIQSLSPISVDGARSVIAAGSSQFLGETSPRPSLPSLPPAARPWRLRTGQASPWRRPWHP